MSEANGNGDNLELTTIEDVGSRDDLDGSGLAGSVQEEADTSKSNRDDETLLAMGYTQELFRGFLPFMNFCYCFVSVGVLSSIVLLYGTGLNTGGPTVLVWGWVITSIFTLMAGASMAEICSTYPSAGSVYHWAGQLAPPRWAPLAAYVCGWFNFLGNAAGDASFANGVATLVSATTDSTSYGPLSTGAQVGLSIAIAFTWALINLLRIDQQGSKLLHGDADCTSDIFR